MFQNGASARIWEVEDKGNYSVCSITTSHKDERSNKYEIDFSHKFVRFVGQAQKNKPLPEQIIKITNCAVKNVYYENGEKKYLKNPSFVIFDYELVESEKANRTPKITDLQEFVDDGISTF